MKKIFVVGACLAMASGTASAIGQYSNKDGYVGLNYVATTYDEDGFVKDQDLGAVSGKIGSKISRYAAVELRGGFGVADETITNNPSSARLELDYLVGAYGVIGFDNNSPVYPYAVVGYTKSKLTLSVSGSSGSAFTSASVSDMSFGAGTNIAISDSFFFNTEYMQYLDKDGAELSGVSVGATYRF